MSKCILELNAIRLHDGVRSGCINLVQQNPLASPLPIPSPASRSNFYSPTFGKRISSMARLSIFFSLLGIWSLSGSILMVAYINRRNGNYDAIFDAPNAIDTARPHQDNHLIINTTDSSRNKWTKTHSLRQCTHLELLIIRRQLPPDDCITYEGQPWLQKCSMSYATRCECH